MRKNKMAVFLGFLTLIVPIVITEHPAQAAGSEIKDWTFIVFLNGKNNLDRFGDMDINEMERVGSTDKINVVVQWGSIRNKTTKRLFVQKDNDTSKVTSPVIQDMGSVDMGDWRNLVEFVQWSVTNYPAKHYFIDVWDHGSGWHLRSGRMAPRDISWDDETGNFMTTKQLGQSMIEAATIIGHKVDVYGSDACLMGMAEVASEMASSVEVSVGSEETEPGEGWPYDALLAKWTALEYATAADVGRILTVEYVKSYQGGSQGRQEVTFSAFDVSKMDRVEGAVKIFGEALMKLDANERKKVVTAASNAQSFAYSDYVDVLDFLKLVEKSQISSLKTDVFSTVRDAVGEFVIANSGTPSYRNALGLAMWIPTYFYSYNSHAEAYKTMNFHMATGWGDVLRYLLQDNPD